MMGRRFLELVMAILATGVAMVLWRIFNGGL